MGRELKRIEEKHYEAPEIMVRAVTARYCIANVFSPTKDGDLRGDGEDFEEDPEIG